MLSKKDTELVKIWRGWERYCESESGRDDARWTKVLRCLDGTATEDEYNSLTGNYVSYGPGELFRAVGPTFGPLQITGPNAIIAYGRCE